MVVYTLKLKALGCTYAYCKMCRNGQQWNMCVLLKSLTQPHSDGFCSPQSLVKWLTVSYMFKICNLKKPSLQSENEYKHHPQMFSCTSVSFFPFLLSPSVRYCLSVIIIDQTTVSTLGKGI